MTRMHRLAISVCLGALLVWLLLPHATPVGGAPIDMGEITFGQNIARMLAPGETHAYLLQLAADGPVAITYTTGQGEELRLEVRSGAPDGTLVESVSNTMGDKRLYLPALTAGTYYVVLPHDNAKVPQFPYTLQVDPTLATTAVTDPVNLPAGGMTNVYPISVADPGPLYVTIRKTTQVNTVAHLFYDKIAGTPVATDSGSYGHLLTTVAQPGTYYLVIYTVSTTQAKPCTISVGRDVPVLAQGEPRAGSLTAPSQIDLYRVECTAGAPLFISLIKPVSWGAYLEIRQGAADGPIVASNDRGGFGNTQLYDLWAEITPTVTGPYFIRVEPYDRGATISTPLEYEVTATQNLPTLSDMPQTVDMPNTFSVRWYRLPAEVNQPLYALADTNATGSVKLSIVRGTIYGGIPATATGAGDQLAYLAKAAEPDYFVRVTNSQVPHFQLTGGSHLPTVTGDAPATGTISNAQDIHWYEVPVDANEQVVLHLDKGAAFATNSPYLFTTPLRPPDPTSTGTGDTVDFLQPTAATTYFVRVSGEAGAYTLRASRTFPALPLGQWVDAGLLHAGDERWFEVTSVAGQPLFLVTDKVGAGESTFEVYPTSLSATPITFGGTYSTYLYLPSTTTATRYLVRKRAPQTGFIADSKERLQATTALPALSAGDTKTGTLASQYQRKFYGLSMPATSPITLQCSYPLTIEEPATKKSLTIGTLAAVAGLGSPAVAVVASPAGGSFSLSATTDITNAGSLYYSSASAEAKVDLARARVGHVKFYQGTNTYLGGEGADAQYLHDAEGTEYATGWLATQATVTGDAVQVSWRHPGMGVGKELLIRATATRVELTCQLDSPRPMYLRNALAAPAAEGVTLTYAVPDGVVASAPYTQSGVAAVYPATLGQLVTPSERWLAFWNPNLDEVYGVTLGPSAQAALSTDNGYTVTRVLCPAGRTAYTVHIARPKPEPPYQAIRGQAAQPALAVAHTADARLVPPSAPITGTVAVQNIGMATANAVIVTCALPTDATYVEGSAAGASYDATARVLTWTAPSLEAGKTKRFTYQFTLSPAAALNATVELVATARCGEQPLPVSGRSQLVVSPPTITTAAPATAGNGGPVTITVTGTCFAPGATITLAQGAAVLPGTGTTVASDRTRASALVDITRRTGTWDVVVTNPGGGTAVLSGAVTLSPGGRGEFWCEVTGPSAIKVNTPTVLTVQYGNSGTVDEVGRVFAVYVPFASYTVGTVRDESGRALASTSQANSLTGPLLFWLPRTGPGSVHTLTVEVQASVSRAVGALYPSISLVAAPLSRTQLDALLADAAIGAFSIGVADKGLVAPLAGPASTAGLSPWQDVATQPLWGAASELVTRLQANAKLKGYVTVPAGQAVGQLLDKMVALQQAGGKYPALVTYRGYTPTANATGPGNDIVGPVGVTNVGYTTPEQMYSYTITGRNPATGASAKQVRVSITLDGSLDQATLQLGELRIGGKVLPLNTAAFPYAGFLDLRPEVNCMAEIGVTFDTLSRKLEWSCIGHDPVTWGVTPVLLPNSAANAPLGEVQVRFSARPKAGLSSGVQVRSRGYVTLDAGVPAATNEKVNAIDATPPTSTVSSLPVVQEAPTFTVSWSGQDEQNGSGLAAYSIYVSDNDGPYTLWKERVTTTSASYTGALGHIYRFYSIAEDAVGHVELPPATADATIKIGREVVIGRGLRFISVPCIPEQADPKLLLGFSEAKWARYLPGTGYVTYGNDPGQQTWFNPPQATLGRAYWGFWLEDKVVEPSGVVLPLQDTFTIDLVAGWNTFGNPWTKALVWDPNAIKVTADGETKTLAEATAAGWVDDYAWRWVPNTSNPNIGQYWMVAGTSVPAALHYLDAWAGCWIKATRPCSLILPAPTGTAQEATATTRQLATDGWQAQLIARTASGEDGFNWFGQGTGAQVMRARSVTAPPAALVPTVELNFEANRAINLCETSTPAPVWRFTVRAPQPGEEVTLSWPDLTAAPRDLGLVLVDEATGTRSYLGTAEAYRFRAPADGTPANFRIETTPRAALQITTLTALTARGTSGVQLGYRLSAPATVTAEVRTLTGKILRRLAAGRARGDEAASMRWDGRDARGVRVGAGHVLVVLTAVGDDGRTVRRSITCQTR